MSKKSVRKPLSIAIGAAVVSSLGVAGVANAEVEKDLFSMEELDNAYLTAGGHGGDKKEEGEGKDGEGKCGEDKKDGEGKCGEGKCGGS